MNMIQFALLSIKGRKLSVSMTLLSIILATLFIFTVTFITRGMENGLKEQAGTYDLIAGAEGSPTQLVINSILYIDKPIANISYEIYEKLNKDDRILQAVPIALGDSFYGAPIVGTTTDYFKPFREGLPERYSLSSGTWFAAAGETVLGKEIANQTGMSVGDTFKGNHGLGDSHDEHEFTYKVVGILEKTGGSEDRAIFTSIESVWEVHEDSEHTEKDGVHWSEEDIEEKQITALLIKPEQLGFAPALKEELDQLKDVQAVYPVTIFRQLLGMLDMGRQVAYLFGSLTLLLAVLMMLFAIISSVSQRKQELQTLSVLGVPRKKAIILVVLENIMISSFSVLFGFISSLGLYQLLKEYTKQNFGIPLANVLMDQTIFFIALSAFAVSVLLSIIPVFGIFYRRKTRGELS